MFEPGEKVICIDDRFNPKAIEGYTQLPEAGKEYTVRDIQPGLDLHQGGMTVAITLEEVHNPPRMHTTGREPGFAPWRFKRAEEVEAESRELVESATNN